MWWEQFEIDLDFAFNAYTHSESRDIHSESMKLRILTKKVNAYFLSTSKAFVMTHMTAISMNITYIHALATFRQEVNRKSPPIISSRRPTRCVQKTERDAIVVKIHEAFFLVVVMIEVEEIITKRKVNAEHPHSYPVTLIDGAIMNVQASYYLGADIWNKLLPHKSTRITSDRNEYKRQKPTCALASLHT